MAASRGLKPKKPRVELFEIVERGAGADVARIGEQRGIDTSGPEFGVAERTDRFDAGTHVRPQFRGCTRAGEAPGHADDCDVRVGTLSIHVLTH